MSTNSKFWHDKAIMIKHPACSVPHEGGIHPDLFERCTIKQLVYSSKTHWRTLHSKSALRSFDEELEAYEIGRASCRERVFALV